MSEFSEGYRDGYKDGYRDGREDLLAKIEKILADSRTKKSFEKELEKLKKEAERK